MDDFIKFLHRELSVGRIAWVEKEEGRTALWDVQATQRHGIEGQDELLQQVTLSVVDLDDLAVLQAFVPQFKSEALDMLFS